MTLYVIVASGRNQKLAGKIAERFPEDHLKLGAGQWLISATGMTTRKISDELDISEGAPAVIVFATSGHYGRHYSDTWEWMASKLDKPSNG